MNLSVSFLRRMGALAFLAMVIGGCGPKKETVETPREEAPVTDVQAAEEKSRHEELLPFLEGELSLSQGKKALALLEELKKDAPSKEASLAMAKVEARLLGLSLKEEGLKEPKALLGDLDESLLGAEDGEEKTALLGFSKDLKAILDEDKTQYPCAERLDAYLKPDATYGEAIQEAVKLRFLAVTKAEGAKAARDQFQALAGFFCLNEDGLKESQESGEAFCGEGSEKSLCQELKPYEEGLGKLYFEPGNQAALALSLLAEKLGLKEDGRFLPVPSHVGRGLSLQEPLFPYTEGIEDILVVRPEGLQLGKAPRLDKGKLSPSKDALPDSQEALPLEVLLKDEKELQGEDEKEALASMKAALAPFLAEEDANALLLAVDEKLPAHKLQEALDALGFGGSHQPVLLLGGQDHATWQSSFLSLPKGLEEALLEEGKAPISLLLQENVIDIFLPEGTGSLDLSALSDKLEPAYRGEALRRLRLSLEKDDEGALTEKSQKELIETLVAIRKAHDTGPLLHLHASVIDSVTLEELVSMSGLLFSASADLPKQKTRDGGEVEAFFPHQGEAGAEFAFWPLMLSKAALPSTKGLSTSPQKAKVVKKEPAKPQPSAAFCNANDIQHKMKAKASGFRFCYESQLQLDNSLAGKVALRFVIDLSGKVQNARIAEDSLKSDKVNACLLRTVRKISFKAPDGGECIVNWPFQFKN